MFFQQWSESVQQTNPKHHLTLNCLCSAAGVNAILYYAPQIFKNLGLDGNTNSLLATGVVGIV